MASIKDIKDKIISIKNTKKITKAMEMVAISKIRKTEKRMRCGRPYLKILKKVISHILQGHSEYQHSYLNNRKTKRVGIIIVSTDRGLCGSLNTNLFKAVLFKMQNFIQNNISYDLILFGSKSISVFKPCSNSILSKMINIGENPNFSELISHINIFLEKYQIRQIDKIFIAYNKFHNKMLQVPTITQLLPLSNQKNKFDKQVKWDYLYEPESKLILDMLFNRYIESQIYQSILENIASEQAARMIAMKTATDNSANYIQDLQLIYNKIRQSNITQELIEIIAGSSALSID